MKRQWVVACGDVIKARRDIRSDADSCARDEAKKTGLKHEVLELLTSYAVGVVEDKVVDPPQPRDGFGFGTYGGIGGVGR